MWGYDNIDTWQHLITGDFCVTSLDKLGVQRPSTALGESNAAIYIWELSGKTSGGGGVHTWVGIHSMGTQWVLLESLKPSNESSHDLCQKIGTFMETHMRSAMTVYEPNKPHPILINAASNIFSQTTQ